MNNTEIFKQAAIKDLKSRGWNGRNACIRELNKATTFDDISHAIYLAAQYIGDRKGYGSEDVGSVWEEFIDSISKACNINFLEEYDKEEIT